MAKFDLLIKNGNIFPLDRVLDVGIRDGRITELRAGIAEEDAEQVIDAENKTVSPGFVDSHMHIDKAFTADEDDTTDLLSACTRSQKQTHESYAGWSGEDIIADIEERSSKVIEMCVLNGTTALKTHVLITPDIGMAAVEAMERLKKKYQDYITICTVVPAYDDFMGKWSEAANAGKIDFIGGYPNSAFNAETEAFEYTLAYKEEVDKAFRLAGEYNLPIDLHCDESDSTNIDCFLYVTKKTYEQGMQGLVTCGHVTGLSAKGMDEEHAADAIARAAKAHVNITTQTSCNMYLMDSSRRGPTRVRQLLDAGINVAVASDNIRDPFRPFGNGDMLEEGILTAQLHKFGTRAGLRKIAQMITYFPAENMLLQDYGILPGCNADLVVLDAPDMSEALLSQVEKSFVIKRGRIVAQNGKIR